MNRRRNYGESSSGAKCGLHSVIKMSVLFLLLLLTSGCSAQFGFEDEEEGYNGKLIGKIIENKICRKS